MNKRFQILFLLVCMCGGMTYKVTAQDTVQKIPLNGLLDSVNSKVLGQKRYIEVFTPPNYTPESTNTYDVLYVLDGGNWNTGLVKQTQHFVEGEGNMPSTIIVSVMGIDRNRELTPTSMENWKGSGEGEKFLRFIKSELVPYIDKKYPSNGDNTLWGHSLSGMFVLYAMLQETSTFKSYIAVDPSLWWDELYIPKMAGSKLPALNTKNTTLFIAGREGTALNEMKIDTMKAILSEKAPENLKWKVVLYPDESHSSVRLKSTYDGLKFTYDGLTSHIEFHPMNGIVMKDKPIPIWYFEDKDRVHYTLDGRVPTPASPKAKPEILLSGPARVYYKRFTNRSRHDKTAIGDFTTGDIIQSNPKPKNLEPGGFKYAYYEVDGDKWPDFKKSKPVKTGVAHKDFNMDDLPRKDHFALLMQGYLEAKEEGYYIFLFEADKHSKLYLDNKPIIEWTGDYRKRTYSYIMPLSKGFHSLKIEYRCLNKDFKLRLSYLTPGNFDTRNVTPIPFELQYRMR
ncbi:alpha/beta hydrolase-fold protein [Sinomicrobium weinanense]|uniref:PA14 domain-containing protein n=1 Tax=Sinomicrobium weinanense TaxID=2842200 RepID=A0A926JPC5_9FLAO|nr:alpha/beta hydrolase-fold protein [Sinomicrobium weinanense]MBC9795005.1 hypothetical protein [Sinomicrobium weinanense]MBU3125134.1 hypothetical protein [Sinomicrobium weinanense]